MQISVMMYSECATGHALVDPPPPVDDRLEVDAVDVLHDDEVRVLAVADVEHLDDVRVLQRSDRRASSRNIATNFLFFVSAGRTRLIATFFLNPRIDSATPRNTSAMPPAATRSVIR